jgi:hypothetical protein
MTFELSPAGVLRAAAFPIEVLDAFGRADVEREELWERTAGNPRFMKAVVLASPSLFARIEQLAPRRRERTKRLRHLETSLYRYLARGATRTTPNGLFAGVATCTFGDEDVVRPAPERLFVSLDLAPFARALEALREREPYAYAGSFRVNPTLTRGADGAFTFMARAPGGAVEQRGLRAAPPMDAWIAGLMEASDGSLDEIARATGVPRATLEQLARAGLLLGGLSLPCAFTSPWEALEQVTLSGAHRGAWTDALRELEPLCGDVASTLNDATAERLLASAERARAVVSDLFQRLSVSVPLPASILRCDLRVPFAVTFGREMQRSLHEALAQYQGAWIDGLSPLSAARRDRRRVLVEALTRRSLALHDAPLEIATEENAAAYEAFYAELRKSVDNVVLRDGGTHDEATSAPWGCLFARLSREGASTILGMNDNPGRIFARHAPLLGKGGAVEWVRERFEMFREKHGVDVVDLVVPFDPNPNVLARSEFGERRIQPWNNAGSDLRGARLVHRQGAIVLELPGTPRATVVSLCSIDATDPVAHLLTLAGFDDPLSTSSRAALLSDPREAHVLRFSPRLTLPCGSTVRPRRTQLPPEVVRSLSRKPRDERVRAFHSLAEELGWPDQVTVTTDEGTPLHVVVSSPLAVEAALEGVEHVSSMIVEETDAHAWLAGADGHHVTDITLPFSREPHAYSSMAKT